MSYKILQMFLMCIVIWIYIHFFVICILNEEVNLQSYAKKCIYSQKLCLWYTLVY